MSSTDHSNNNIIGHLFAVFPVMAWGTSFLVSKNLLAVLTPIQLMWLRFVIAYIALWIIHPVWYFQWRDELRFLAMAVAANTLYFYTENTALTLTQATNVSILVSTAPILSAILLSLSRKKEVLSRQQKTGYGVAFIGVVFVVLNGALVLHLRPAGDLLALASAMSWAVYNLFARNMLERFDSFLVSRKLMLYGIISAFPMVLAEGQKIQLSAIMSPEGIASLFYLGIICSAVCFVLWNSAIARIGTLKTNLYIYAVPLVTMLAGVLLQREKVTGMGLLGIALVVGGMVLSNLDKSYAVSMKIVPKGEVDR